MHLTLVIDMINQLSHDIISHLSVKPFMMMLLVLKKLNRRVASMFRYIFIITTVAVNFCSATILLSALNEMVNK